MSTQPRPTLDPAPDKPPRPRRWIPLSLKIFMGTLLLVGVSRGLWIGIHIWREQAAIRELERLGAQMGTEPGGPAWLRQSIGDDWMQPFDKGTIVVWGSFTPKTITDAEMPAFEQLIHVQKLDLRGAPITDAGLKHLHRLSDLRFLDLRNTRVTDAGLIHLKGMKGPGPPAYNRIRGRDCEAEEGIAIVGDQWTVIEWPGPGAPGQEAAPCGYNRQKTIR